MGQSAWSEALLVEGGWQFPLLLIGLLLFGESFQYVVDLLPLYLFTKAWPVLTIPLAAYGLLRCRISYRWLLLITSFWVLIVSPFMSVIMLGNGVLGAVSSTAKVLPLGTGFSMAAVLALTRIPPIKIRAGILTLGGITLAAFLLLALVTPDSAYHQGIDATKIFLWDEVRGRRLYLPAFFGVLSLFIVARSCWARPRADKFLILAIGFAVMLFLYKQRLAFAAAVAVTAIGFAFFHLRWRKIAAIAVIAAGLALLVPLAAYLRSEQLIAHLGGSLSARQQEMYAALIFLERHPIAWVLGAGSATRVGEVGFADILGTDYFFLADLGWLGVLFEYGLIGCVLLVLLIASGLRLGWRAAAKDRILGGASFDYALFFLLTSITSTVVFAPGELMFCMALANYLLLDGISSSEARSRSIDVPPHHVARQRPDENVEIQLERPVTDVE